MYSRVMLHIIKFLSKTIMLNDVSFINWLMRIIKLVHLDFIKNYQLINEWHFICDKIWNKKFTMSIIFFIMIHHSMNKKICQTWDCITLTNNIIPCNTVCQIYLYVITLKSNDHNSKTNAQYKFPLLSKESHWHIFS